MADARAKTKTTKRRKVWVNWYDAAPSLHVTRLSARKFLVKSDGGVTVPFIESRPGDVVLSREEAESLRYGLEQVGQSTPRGSDDANRISYWIALLRGGR